MEQKVKGSFYGITREDEEKKLIEVNEITRNKLESTKQMVSNLAAELHEQKEVYDADDKEGLAQWFNTDARFQEVRQDLLRAERARKKPYFGRIDFVEDERGIKETYYIGKTLIAEDPSEPIVIDWRTPIASVYYDHSLGKCSYKVPREGNYKLDLQRKRTYEIENNLIKNYYDSDVVANDDLLTEYLSKSKRNVLSEIIATIQQEQNEIIRMNPHHNIVVQGSAGSGKTTVAMHRISYILYNYDLEFKPEGFYIIGSNKVLLNYITGVLPDLDVFGVTQMTMEELFVRLLYEEWDKKFTIKKADKYDPKTGLKGTDDWFRDLKIYCDRFEWKYIPRNEVVVEKTGHVLIKKDEIERVIKQYSHWSLYDKLEKLTDILISHLETEIYGKYYSYNPEEQKALLRSYKQYYKKMQWNGSVFEFYEEFLQSQTSRGKESTYESSSPDIYDLAALAYIYKRFKETEVIQEASHVVIDEAQDFGMMIYQSLKYCMSKCTFTVMGDVSQNINLNSGLGDWEALKKLMLPDKYDSFGLLRKSYRNTVEISKFATDILKHGTFPVYPVEPIIRHGNDVARIEAKDEGEIIDKLAYILDDWKKKDYETIAVITKDVNECEILSKKLNKKTKVRAFTGSDTDFGPGIMIIPIEYSKGLEFDAVAIFNPTKEAYPMEDGYAKLLYVAATRALHELTIVYEGELTELISTPVPAGRENNIITEDNYHLKPFVFEEDTRTIAEIAASIAKEGDEELRRREVYGPKRSEVIKVGTITSVPDTSKRTLRSIETNKSRISINTKPSPNVTKDVWNKDTFKAYEASSCEEREPSVFDQYKPKAIKPENERKQVTTEKPSAYKRTSIYDPKPSAYKKEVAVSKIGLTYGTTYGSASEKKAETTNVSYYPTPEIQKAERPKAAKTPKSEFGRMPEGTSLQPSGHGKIDNSVKWVKADKSQVEVTGGYGILRIIPISEETVRFIFSKSPVTILNPLPEETPKQSGFKWKVSESREALDMLLPKMKVHIDKKTGAVSFYNGKNQLLLSENVTTARQLHPNKDIWWEYLDFGKKETITARGEEDYEWTDINSAAKYISHSEKPGTPALVMSNKGYQLFIPYGIKALLCTIPAFGPYIMFEESNMIDFIIRSVI